MDYLLGVISARLSDPETVQLVFTAVIAMAVVALALGVLFLVNAMFDRERSRVEAEVNSSRGADAASSTSWVASLLSPISRIALPAKQKELNKTALRLSYAGYRASNAAGVFYSIKLVALIGLPALVFLAAPLVGGLTNVQVVFAAWTVAALGIVVPNRILASKIHARQKRLRDGFPDALDLLVVCSQAGLGLGSAIQRVADELVVSHPELADELNQVSAEMRAGVDRSESLRNLATRNGLEDFRGFVATLSQAMRFGSSVSETLTIYADEFRDKRMQRAEEIAAKLPVKMIFPLALCLLPAFMIVALGPSVLKVLVAFGR